MTVRHFLKQILQPLPGFAGMFQRREQLREQARTIEALRAELEQANQTLKQAEEQKWLLFREREEADTAKWEAIRQREQAEEARWQAIREREGADAAREEAMQHAAAERARAQAAVEHLAAAPGEEQLGTAQHLQWKDVPHLEKQGLFVVGHARSGTSILMQALNTSSDIFMLGEANLYAEGSRLGFPDWYNDMHHHFGNPRSKGFYCPTTPDPKANGPETLKWLSERFRYVGEKVAFRSETLGYSPAEFFEFHARHFFASHYVCTVRNPADVLKSNDDMFKPQDLAIYADSYLQTLGLIVEMVDTFPNVLVVFHEEVTQATFESIGNWLDVDLTSAFALYERQYQTEGRWGSDNAHLPLIDILTEAHRSVRNVFSPDTLRPLRNPEWRLLPYRIRAMRKNPGTAALPVREQ